MMLVLQPRHAFPPLLYLAHGEPCRAVEQWSRAVVQTMRQGCEPRLGTSVLAECARQNVLVRCLLDVLASVQNARGPWLRIGRPQRLSSMRKMRI